VREFASAMLEHDSPPVTVCDAHDPSELGLGAKSGRLPLEQQTCWPGISDEQNVGLGLYTVTEAGGMLHLLAILAQLSPDAICTALQSARRPRPRRRLRCQLVNVPLPVAFKGDTSGVVKPAVLAMVCAPSRVRHVPFSQV
jgi:hypothetical protein